MEENKHWIESDETAHQRIKQAQTLKEQACRGGLKFEAYLTPDLAVWVLDRVEKGIFIDPSEAVFVLMGQAKDIEPHEDLKMEILKRHIEKGMQSIDEGKAYSSGDVRKRLEDMLKDRAEPAIWKKISHQS